VLRRERHVEGDHVGQRVHREAGAGGMQARAASFA
jgi:hypothetical protein